MLLSSIELESLRAIGLTPPVVEQLSRLPPLAGEPCLMRVTEVQREGLTLHDGIDERPARALPRLLQSLQADADALAVGDWVLAEAFAHDEWWVHTRVPPLTQLARRLHDGRDKVTRTVIVSNVDTAMLVMGLDLDFSLRRLERYLALVRMAGIGAVVVLSKADIGTEVPQRLEAVRAMVPADVGVVAVNTLSDDSRAALAGWLEPGRTLVLLGSSGAGKSSLTNTLVGHEVQATGGLRRGDGRGRHTTTARCLRRTPEGACIIDTPGLRTLRLDGDEQALAASFADIAEWTASCRFRNCSHTGEPGCAVREHVAPERLLNYGKLLREARRDTMSALERKQQVAQWKARSRATRSRMQDKRGEQRG